MSYLYWSLDSVLLNFYFCNSSTGAFLIAYTVMIGLVGMPMLLMEFSFGQYFGVGGLSIFKQVCPLFQGEYHKNADLYDG
jgi:SNF family Na+-dependent transporter